MVPLASSKSSRSTITFVPHDGQLCVVLVDWVGRVDPAGCKGSWTSTDMSLLLWFSLGRDYML